MMVLDVELSCPSRGRVIWRVLYACVWSEVLDSHPLLAAFQVMLFEHIIMCRLITGNKTAAIQEVHMHVIILPRPLCYLPGFIRNSLTPKVAHWCSD